MRRFFSKKWDFFSAALLAIVGAYFCAPQCNEGYYHGIDRFLAFNQP
ncbi:hypothetical protein ACFSKM_16505 [Ancylobacter dichloromethanicus]